VSDREEFLDRAAIAFVAAGMDMANACSLAERLLAARIAQDKCSTEQAAAERAAEEAAGIATRIAAVREAAASVDIWSPCPFVYPDAEEAFADALAARGLAVWRYGHEAWIVSKAEADEAERLYAAIVEKNTADQIARDAKYRQERRESAKRSWESHRSRLRAEASS
jgi:hypothetical protein